LFAFLVDEEFEDDGSSLHELFPADDWPLVLAVHGLLALGRTEFAPEQCHLVNFTEADRASVRPFCQSGTQPDSEGNHLIAA
jgi:hypothetical protein